LRHGDIVASRLSEPLVSSKRRGGDAINGSVSLNAAALGVFSRVGGSADPLIGRAGP